MITILGCPSPVLTFKRSRKPQRSTSCYVCSLGETIVLGYAPSRYPPYNPPLGVPPRGEN